MHIAANRTRATIKAGKFGLALALLLAWTLNTASASDYAHVCRSADGSFSMNDEELRAFDVAQGRETGPAIPYKVLRRIDLSKSAGFCVANDAPRGQRRFKHAATTYALHISFRRQARTIRTFMVCELASSGLPAAYNCDREVQTLNWVIGGDSASNGQVAANGSADPGDASGASPVIWMHNGSEVRIEAEGRRRRIIYVEPREGLIRRGVTAGSVLFEGERNGDRYTGRAYIFTARCGAVAYEVDGRVERGERRVVVRGRAPRVNARCRITSWRDDRLVFERQ